MPRLAKGGKWVFGWVLVGAQGKLTIPPEACDEYGFQTGDEVIFLPGSRTSGGFGLSSPRLLAQMAAPVQTRALCRGQIGENGQLVVPSAVGLQLGTRLHTVRGSGRALGFLVRGPIYDEALKHPELDVFGQAS
jgi:hypothetical protein